MTNQETVSLKDDYLAKYKESVLDSLDKQKKIDLKEAKDKYVSNVLENRKEQLIFYDYLSYNGDGSIDCPDATFLRERNRNLLKFSKKLFMICHNKDEIKGKPINIYQTKKSIDLVRKVKIIPKDDKILGEYFHYVLLGDRFDKRTGYTEDVLSLDFYLYKVVSDDKEYIILSKETLDSEEYTLQGEIIELYDNTEITKTFKLSGKISLFIVWKANSSKVVIDKKDLQQWFKDNIQNTNADFQDFIFTHKDKYRYYYEEMLEKLITYQILSGKYNDYPLHILLMGKVGCGKTTLLECLNEKFKEREIIFEAGTSTLKGIIPSFKEKIADPGYLMRVNRFGIIDEFFKMLQRQGQYNIDFKEQMGQINSILEHKERLLGSGNNNSFKGKATAKYIFATNPIDGRKNIREHFNVIDKTSISRFLVYEYNSDKKTRERYNQNNLVFEQHFFTIYDSCQQFIIKGDEQRVENILNELLKQINDEELKDVFKARGLHHAILLLDGIIKYRALFFENEVFEVQECDYIELYNILEHLMLRSIKI